MLMRTAWKVLKIALTSFEEHPKKIDNKSSKNGTDEDNNICS
jgi:hypothetical protein